METHRLPLLTEVASERLTARLYELRVEERHRLVEFLAYLAELERRRLHLDLGFSSTFAFCTEHLGLTKGAAFRRTTAARLLARFPIVGAYLADGRLNLTTLVELRDVLDEARLIEILDRAAGRSEDDVKMLVASLRPQPEPADLLRRLPAPAALPVSPSSGSGPNQVATDVSQPTLAAPIVMSPAAPVRIAPIAEERYVIRASVGKEFVDDLQTVKALLSHKVPDGDLEQVLHECLRIAATVLTKKRRGAGKTSRVVDAAETKALTRTRHIPAAIRDEVWRRDDSRCAFVAPSGRRCNSTWQLEIHHLVPFARGGPSTADQLQLRCRRHNLRAAELDFGVEHMAHVLGSARARSPLRNARGEEGSPATEDRRLPSLRSEAPA